MFILERYFVKNYAECYSKLSFKVFFKLFNVHTERVKEINNKVKYYFRRPTMKKKLLSILIAIFLIAGTAYAVKGLKHYGHNPTASYTAAVTAKPGVLYHLIVTGNGGTTNTLNVYDFATNGAATTTEIELIPSMDITAGTNPDDRVINLDPPVRFFDGIYVVFTSGTNEVMLYFENEQ
jgi:hypothetical protein